MALQGTLETFSVPEVLRLLAGTRKTGMLALEGDRGAGQVWLHEGRIAGARSAHEADGGVEPVLFDLLRYAEGSFVFDSDAEYPGDTPADADVEAALGAAEQLLEEWHEIAAVVPSLRVWVSMVPTIATSSVTVSADEWAALAIVGRGTSGHRLADELGLGELDGSRRIRDLVAAGLVEVDDTPVPDDDPAPARTDDSTDDLTDELGEDGTWTTTDDLTVGLAGFVARASDEERSERAPALDISAFELPADLDPDDSAPELGEPVTRDDLVAIDAPADELLLTDVSEVGTPVADVPTDEDPELELPEIEASDADALEPGTPDLEIVDDPSDAQPVPAALVDDEGDPDEFLSQLANLSPKAAAAIEATASAGETTTRRAPEEGGDEELNRNLLLKFLSSAKP